MAAQGGDCVCDWQTGGWLFTTSTSMERSDGDIHIWSCVVSWVLREAKVSYCVGDIYDECPPAMLKINLVGLVPFNFRFGFHKIYSFKRVWIAIFRLTLKSIFQTLDKQKIDFKGLDLTLVWNHFFPSPIGLWILFCGF